VTDRPFLRSATPERAAPAAEPTAPTHLVEPWRPAHRTTGWRRSPAGRFAVPAVALVVVLVLAWAAGRFLTPAISPLTRPSQAADAASSVQYLPGQAPGGAPPTLALTLSAAASGAALTRPQDALAGWAQKVSPAVGIPVTALQAYGYATLRLAADQPLCHLGWTTLAAIGKVESDHGAANHAKLGTDGKVTPPIIGAALNGQGSVQLIRDTDGGRYDGDQVYDHAVGPMQFIPATWQRYQVDADRDGTADPQDINDAALAAASYLCAGGRDLSTSGGWWGAVLSYNAIQAYATNVFDAANSYGQRSRTVA